MEQDSKMRILHFGSLDIRSGGPAMSIYLTLRGLNDLGMEAEVMMFAMDAGGRLRGEDVSVHYAKRPWEQLMAFSPSLKREMSALPDYDVYHAQGVWQWHTYAVASVARKKGRPYVISPRGMLYPQDIAKSNAFFKKLSLSLRLRSDLNRAACVHATCEEEMNHLRAMGVKSPIAVFPNPIVVRQHDKPASDNVCRIGYLGRVSPRKHVERLIRAFAALGDKAKNAELFIVGNAGDDYERQLRKEVEDLGLTNVIFAGFLGGEEKEAAIAKMSVLANPSDFENFGNVIIEGLVHRVPCIATTGSPWKELTDNRCGWWVEPTQEDITAAVAEAIAADSSVLDAMGARGFDLVSEKYSVEAVAAKAGAMYQWIVGQTDKPSFIHTL